MLLPDEYREETMTLAPMPDKDAQFGSSLLAWYHAHKRDLPWRRLAHDPYAVWVSEIMLQQTTVAAVVPFYERWMARFPTLQSLAEAPLDDVLKHWAGLGYYARARNLHRGAQTVLTLHNGQVPSAPDALLALPGVGRYTAGAIASIAFGQDAPIVDANVIRVLSRVYAVAGDPKTSAAVQAHLWTLAEQLIPPGQARDFNQAMMELGALVCVPNAPKCAACPVSKLCAAYELGEPTAYPQFMQTKKWLDIEDVSVAVRDREGRVLLAQRSPALPLWGGLWELPRVTRQAGETLPACAARAACEAAGITVNNLRPFGHVKHTVANRRVTLHGWQGEAAGSEMGGHAHALAWEPLEHTRLYALATPQTRLLEQLIAADAQGQLDFGGAHSVDIALAIIRHPHTEAILIARRMDDTHMGGLWEFPGGKCRHAEAPDACAVRETREETGLAVVVLEAWPAITHAYPERTVTLHPFLCRAQTGDALPLASREVRWVLPSALPQYEFPSANAALVARLRAHD